MTSQALVAQPSQSAGRGVFMTFMTGAALAVALALSQTTPSQAQERPVTFADLAEQVSPAVVNITTSTTIAGRIAPRGVVHCLIRLYMCLARSSFSEYRPLGLVLRGFDPEGPILILVISDQSLVR